MAAGTVVIVGGTQGLGRRLAERATTRVTLNAAMHREYSRMRVSSWSHALHQTQYL